MEIWKDIYFVENNVIYDYRGLYQVSNFGRVKSLKYGKERILKPGENTKGYEYVVLCNNGKQKNFLIHRLVAHMFIEGYFDEADVDHIDTNPLNNHVSNLRWCTRKENCNNELSKKHYSEANKGDKNKGKNNPMYDVHRYGEKAPNLGSLIDRFDKQGNLIDTKYQFEYVEELGFNQSGISNCCKGRIKSTGGYVFKYHNK